LRPQRWNAEKRKGASPGPVNQSEGYQCDARDRQDGSGGGIAFVDRITNRIGKYMTGTRRFGRADTPAIVIFEVRHGNVWIDIS